MFYLRSCHKPITGGGGGGGGRKIKHRVSNKLYPLTTKECLKCTTKLTYHTRQTHFLRTSFFRESERGGGGKAGRQAGRQRHTERDKDRKKS